MVLVLCKVLCNVLGGTENDKSLASTAATFSDNLPPTLRKQQHKATTCVGLLQSLAEVRIEDHLLVFFRNLTASRGTECYKHLHDSYALSRSVNLGF
jgi:hypothetical protein